jgi:hypothetical protein
MIDDVMANLMESLNERDRTLETLDLRQFNISTKGTTVDAIIDEVNEALVPEKHRYKGRFACRVVGETPKWYKIILWGELGHAELHVVDKVHVTPKAEEEVQ